MNIAKHTLIYFLIFAFLSISFFGNSIKPAKAASYPTGILFQVNTYKDGWITASGSPVTFPGGKIKSSVCKDSQGYENFPAGTLYPASQDEMKRLEANSNFKNLYPSAFECSGNPRYFWGGTLTTDGGSTTTTFQVSATTSGDDIKLSWNKLNLAETYNITRTDTTTGDMKTLSNVAKTVITYTDKTVPDGQYIYRVQGITADKSKIVPFASISVVKKGTEFTTSRDEEGTEKPSGTGDSTDDESCTKHCPGGTWWWKVDENIQNAICNMQCTIIDWESSMIGWVVSKVLYPALGLCVENDPSKPCPEPPTTTETK